MEITYYGHSCFSVMAAERALLFDPYISSNPLASSVNIDTISADYIFASHAHFDHITDLVHIAGNTGAKAIGCWELYNYFNANGLTNTHPINPGGKYTFDFGTVKCFNAMHSTALQTEVTVAPQRPLHLRLLTQTSTIRAILPFIWI